MNQWKKVIAGKHRKGKTLKAATAILFTFLISMSALPMTAFATDEAAFEPVAQPAQESAPANIPESVQEPAVEGDLSDGATARVKQIPAPQQAQIESLAMLAEGIDAAEAETFEQLEAAIDEAPTDGIETVITVRRDLYFNSGALTIAAGKNIVLAGSGVSLYAYSGSHFSVRGALTLAESNSLTLTADRYTDPSRSAGGVSVISGGRFVMRDGSISGNRGYTGGGVSVIGGTFELYGGAISENKAMTSRSYADSGRGGGVYVRGDSVVEIRGGVISGNTVAADSGDFRLQQGLGGGIYFEQGKAGQPFFMDGGLIDNNTADISGGGLYIKGYADILGGVISNNKTTIRSEDPNNFFRYESSYGGGGIRMDGQLTVGGSAVIKNNISAQLGGGISVQSGSLTLTGGASVAGNKAATSGGGVAVGEGPIRGDVKNIPFVIEDNARVEDNETTGGHGGGLYLATTSAAFNGGIISDNRVTSRKDPWGALKSDIFNHAGDGGGVYLQTPDRNIDTKGAVSVVVKDIVFSNNTAVEYGGGLFFRGAVTVNSGTFTGNEAGYDGGGMYVNDVIMTSGAFSKNTARGTRYSSSNSSDIGYGGAVYAGGTVQISGGKFENNKALAPYATVTSGQALGGAGGAVAAGAGSISNAVFAGNLAAVKGGAVAVSWERNAWEPAEPTATVSGCTFESNSAHQGGALYTLKCAVSGSAFAGNTSVLGGGAISATYGAQRLEGLTVDVASHFESNTATRPAMRTKEYDELYETNILCSEWSDSPDVQGERRGDFANQGYNNYDIQFAPALITIIFDGNQHTGGTVPATIYNSMSGSVKVPGQGSLERYGYTFAGWGTTTTGNIKNEGTALYESVTLYAVWRPDRYTITFDANGGAGFVPKNPVTVLYTTTRVETLPYTTDNAGKQKPDYFIGWNTKPDGSGGWIGKTWKTSADLYSYPAGGYFADTVPSGYFTGNITVYAQFKPDIITYEGSNGITVGGDRSVTQNAAYGRNLALLQNPFVRSGYKFTGWMVSDSYGYGKYGARGTIYQAGYEFEPWAWPYPATGNANVRIVLTAQWERLPQPTELQFYLNYNSSDETRYKPGEDANPVQAGKWQLTEFAQPTRDGYIFDGWYSERAPQYYYYYYKPYTDERGNVHDVPYYFSHDEYGGGIGEPYYGIYTGVYDENALRCPDVDGNPKPPYNGQEYIPGESWIYDPYTIGTTVTKIYAQWSAKEYAVTFVDWNGAILKTEQVTWGGSAAAPAHPARAGFSFLRWDRDYTNVRANITVTALYVRDAAGGGDPVDDGTPGAGNPGGGITAAVAPGPEAEVTPQAVPDILQDEDVPTSASAIDSEEDAPLSAAPFAEPVWALVNLLLAVIGIAASVITGLRALASRKRQFAWLIFAFVMGAAGIIFFLLTEDMTGLMTPVDNRTIVNALILIAEFLGIGLFFRRRKDRGLHDS